MSGGVPRPVPLNDFLEAYKRYKPKMWVEAPETVKTKGLLGKTVMTYNVVMRGGHLVYNVGGVRKRYSEFEALRVALEKRYGVDGMLVPPLPPKKLSLDSELVKSRMRGLSLFVESLSASPFLMSDATLERFLTCGVDGLEVSLDGTLGSSGGYTTIASEDDNVGYIRWNEQLDAWALPPDADTQLNKVKGELDVVEKALKEVLEASKGLGSGLAHLCKGMGSLANAMNAMAEAETEHVDTLNEVSGGDEAGSTNSVPRLSQETAAFATGAAPGYRSCADQMDLLFHDVLEYEIVQMQNLRNLLRHREDLFNAVFKQQKRLYALQTTPAEKLDKKARAEMESLGGKAAKDEALHARVTKALLFYTVPLLARERRINLNRAFGALAAVTASANAAAYQASMTLLSQLRLDPTQLVTAANEEAARLGLAPIEHIAGPAGPSAAGSGQDLSRSGSNKPPTLQGSLSGSISAWADDSNPRR